MVEVVAGDVRGGIRREEGDGASDEDRKRRRPRRKRKARPEVIAARLKPEAVPGDAADATS